MEVTIPKGSHEDGYDFTPGHPAWFPCRDGVTGKKLKPLIRCNCGRLCGIGLHHVHADGKVTASFFDEHKPPDYAGCGWHVHLTLADYDEGDFPPEK